VTSSLDFDSNTGLGDFVSLDSFGKLVCVDPSEEFESFEVITWVSGTPALYEPTSILL
jgi:hypothetical protein